MLATSIPYPTRDEMCDKQAVKARCCYERQKLFETNYGYVTKRVIILKSRFYCCTLTMANGEAEFLRPIPRLV